LIRHFYAELVGTGDYSNLDSFVAADYVDHNAAEESGRAGGRRTPGASRPRLPEAGSFLR
jgi:hypothetical protein